MTEVADTSAMASLYPFERFTDQAKRALTVAQTEAERSHHSYIGTEHVLLALFQVEGAMASRILADLGVEIGSVRATINKLVRENERIVIQQIIPTSRVKKVVEIAFEEGRRLGEASVGTQHLLLGLLIEGDGIAAHTLGDMGVTVERVSEAIGRLSAAGMHETAAPSAPMPGSPDRRALDPNRMARGLDDLTAVELLAGLLNRFGATAPPPPSLLKMIAELRDARRRKEAAVGAQDYEAAKRHRDEELRLEADAIAQLKAWRHGP